MRVGQKNKLTYRWARNGSRPCAVHDQRTQSTWLFGAVCPERGTASGLVLPVCNAEAMQLHLDDIAAKVAPRAHAILVFDQAGWHGAKALKTPPNISLMSMPPRSPELNPQENIWQVMRANWLSNRVFKSYDEAIQKHRDPVVQRSADLLFNLTVLWASIEVAPKHVWKEMNRRVRLFGIAEKLTKPRGVPKPRRKLPPPQPRVPRRG